MSWTIEAIAEHSMMRSFAVGRPDGKGETELKAFAKKFDEVLKNNILPEQVNVPGKYSYIKLMKLLIHPNANKECIKRGVSTKTCPVKAIPYEKPNKTDKIKCITCMRCVEVCPKKSRLLSPCTIALSTALMKKKICGRKENKLYL